MNHCANTQCSEYGNCDLFFDCPLFKPTSTKPKINKYQAQKCEFNGEKFDSKRELQRWLELRLLERSGEITGLKRQVKFELIPSQKDEKGKCLERAVTYIADFVYKDKQGKTVVEDTKGIKTKEYIIKRKRVHFMDNNVLACKYGIEQMRELAKTDYLVDFNQGLDVMLLTDEIVEILSRIKWGKYIRFSCDKEYQLPYFEKLVVIVRDIYFQPLYMFYGLDSGITSDATAVSAWALYPDGKLIKLSTFYLNIAEERKKKCLKGISHTDQVELMLEWYNAFRKKFAEWGITIPSTTNERWCFDGAGLTQDLMLEWQKATGFAVKAVTDKDIERDIARLVNSFRSGQLLILDIPENEISIEELENFVRDENNEIPDGQSDHTIDADKYATYEYYYDFL